MHVILKHMDIETHGNNYRFLPGQGIKKDFILWSISFDKKLRYHVGSGVKGGITLRFKTNSSVTLILALLLAAGDVCPNPGPPKLPCENCKKVVPSNQKGVCCDRCNLWFHANKKCRPIDMTDDLYQDLSTSDQSWHCNICSNKISIQTNNEDLIPDHSDELDEDIYTELKENLKIKGLEVAHLNVNGLFHKLSEVPP